MSLPSQREDCTFCRIGRGEHPSIETIAEGTNWIAFFPLEPAVPGHTLVIPRAHHADLWAVPVALAAELVEAVIEVGHAIDTALTPEGMNLITSAGSAAEQSVFHVHLHVVPRWNDDGFGRIWPPDQHHPVAEVRDVAERLRRAMRGSA